MNMRNTFAKGDQMLRTAIDLTTRERRQSHSTAR